MRAIQVMAIAASVAVAAFLIAAAVTLPLGAPRSATPQPQLSAVAGGASVLPDGAATDRPFQTLEPTPIPTVAEASPSPSPSPSATSSPTSTPALEIGVSVGQLAPDFELSTPEGELIRLSDFRGRPVWINFWAPWCPACLTEMPRLEGFYLEHQADGLVVLGVGVRDTPDGMRAYADDLGVSYPIVVDADGAVADRYRALALPVHYWLDRQGVVREWAFGELPPDLLASSLELILAEEP